MNKPQVRRAAEEIAAVLRGQGFEALFAGGCVRDLLLGLVPKDYDVATNATPDEVVGLFRRTERVGAKFGVVIVRTRGTQVEVATFRSDGDYRDGRRPDSVRFASAAEDAQRRDFTINGMFLDPADNRIIDQVGGQADIRAQVVRAIGDPEQRFAEDHLRMLRAVRFAARLGFEIDAATFAAIQRHSAAITGISAERIQQELAQILGAPGRERGWRLLAETGLIQHVLPGAAWSAETQSDAEARLAELPADADFMLGLAAALAGSGAASAARTCRELRCSVAVEKGVAWLIDALPRALSADTLELADVKLLMADRRYPALVALARAEALGVRRAAEAFERLERRTSAIPAERVAPPPLLDGEDLQNMGIAPGPIYGRVLGAAYRAQLNETIFTRDEARRMAGEMTGREPNPPEPG